MFESVQSKRFTNKPHIGDFCEVAFDICVDNAGKEEIETVETSLHYLQFGSGEPLLLIHGIGESLYTWRKCFMELAKFFTVYVLDLPAHGCSEKPHMSYTVEEYALAIEAFMNKVGLEKTHFMTHGEGAAYVLDFAQHNARRTGDLILVSPMLDADDDKGGCYSAMAAISSRMFFSAKSFARDFEEVFFDKTLIKDYITKEYFTPFADKDFRYIVKLSAQNYNDSEIKAKLHKVASSILIVRGEDDKVSPPVKRGIAAYPLRDAKAFSVRNCGYLVQEEKPEKLTRAAIQFIGRDA